MPADLIERLRAIQAHRKGSADADLITEILDAFGQHEDKVRQAVLTERARCLGLARAMQEFIVDGGR